VPKPRRGRKLHEGDRGGGGGTAGKVSRHEKGRTPRKLVDSKRDGARGTGSLAPTWGDMEGSALLNKLETNSNIEDSHASTFGDG